jgi:hypothetical protein
MSKGIAHDSKRLNLTSSKGDHNKSWIGTHFDITDSIGYFIQNDGTRSRVIHQWDRFGSKLGNWLKNRATEIYL